MHMSEPVFKCSWLCVGSFVPASLGLWQFHHIFILLLRYHHRPMRRSSKRSFCLESLVDIHLLSLLVHLHLLEALGHLLLHGGALSGVLLLGGVGLGGSGRLNNVRG